MAFILKLILALITGLGSPSLPIPDISVQPNQQRTFRNSKIGKGHFGTPKLVQVRISAGQNWCRSESLQAKIGAGQNRLRPKSAQAKISAGQNQRRPKSMQAKIGSGRNRLRPKSAQAKIGSGLNRCRPKSAHVKIGTEKNEPTLLYSALIKKKFMCKVNSFAFNGNLLHWEHDCIFALPLRLSVNHYYKQVIVFT